jgi:hypothetical protein
LRFSAFLKLDNEQLDIKLREQKILLVELKRELQHDMNAVCKNRGLVKYAASEYDNYVWKCNNPPYGVRYVDCYQSLADQMAGQVRKIASIRDNTEEEFVAKWGSSVFRTIICY